MSYLLDKRSKDKKMMIAGACILVLLVGFFLRGPLSYFFSRTASAIALPFWKIGTNIKENFSGYSFLVKSKKALFEENQSLKEEILGMQSDISLKNVLSDENAKLKEILARKDPKKHMVLASILSKPNRSPYDELTIDTGEKDGVIIGQKVFAYGNILIGQVIESYPSYSRVKLFSTSGEKTEVVLSGSDIYLSAIGRGGGSFEILAPRDLLMIKGGEILAPGMDLKVVALVEEVVSDQRDSFQKVILRSPVNVQELKWVEVEK